MAESSKHEILNIEEPETFELALHGLVRRLGTSHTGFFHQSVRRVPARLAIGASFRKVDQGDGKVAWIVQDVHEGGPAYLAGLKALDALVGINGEAIAPPDQPMLPMGTLADLMVQRNSHDLTQIGRAHV